MTRKEWDAYYSNISNSIDDDDYFELMIRNAWHLPGGEGWCANTANLRVLVTKSDGTQSVEMIEDDLGLDASDSQQVLAKLRRQGVDAIDVRLYGAVKQRKDGARNKTFRSTLVLE